MQTRSGRARGWRGARVLATLLIVPALSACGGAAGPAATLVPTGAPTLTQAPASTQAPVATDGPTPTQGPAATDETQPTSNAVPGAWSGTITYHAVSSKTNHTTSESGDAGSTFHQTTVEDDVTNEDATDVFTVTGKDPEDLTYGIGTVDLTGQDANNGNALERVVFTTDKYNALGCHYTDETGDETSGPWSQNTNAGGNIHFQDDGTYTITMGAAGDPVTGEMPDSPKLVQKLWTTYTILSGAPNDCPPPGRTEVDTTNGPIIEFPSSLSGAYTSIDGHANLASPGSVLDGNYSFKSTLPDADVTVTWHLVHQGPITLPHE